MRNGGVQRLSNVRCTLRVWKHPVYVSFPLLLIIVLIAFGFYHLAIWGSRKGKAIILGLLEGIFIAASSLNVTGRYCMIEFLGYGHLLFMCQHLSRYPWFHFLVWNIQRKGKKDVGFLELHTCLAFCTFIEYFYQYLCVFGQHPEGSFVHPSGVEQRLHDSISAMKRIYGDEQGKGYRVWVDRVLPSKISSDTWLAKFVKWEILGKAHTCPFTTPTDHTASPSLSLSPC